MKTRIIVYFFIVVFFTSCKKETNNDGNPKYIRNDQILVQELNQELNPLTQDPLSWSDSNLQFLDAIADKPMIGLGEATHGTSEFFKAKHRIFKYLVEKHNYKIFAFEADFGESMFINEAIQNSNSAQIENLMQTKMQFWTWKTEEVKDLLLWMCKYNIGKAENEKVQYMGIDCQYITYTPRLLEDYLIQANAPFLSYASEVLQSTVRYCTFSSYEHYLTELDNLLSTMVSYKSQLIAASSEKKYLLNERILKTIMQVLEVKYKGDDNEKSIARDKYMADNAVWMLNYFDGEKTVVWAHDGHIGIGTYNSGNNMGNYLSQSLTTNYVPIGFLFSTGNFNAIGQGVAQQGYAPTQQAIYNEPKENSINFLMRHSSESVFSVKVADLLKHSEWKDVFLHDIQYFWIGAGFDPNPDYYIYYYKKYDPTFFNYLIYFNNTTASALLK